jgi:hypothetical protein
LITLTYQITASLLQPLVGLYTDHYPKPYSLSIGIGCTLTGLITLALAQNYSMVLFAAALVGAAVLGKVADAYGIEYVYRLCSFLPLLGVFTVFLPDIGKPSHN